MKHLFALLVLGVALLSFAAAARPAVAGVMPPTDRSRGLVYDGLAPGGDGCPGGYKLQSRANGVPRCTHGPDGMPGGKDVAYSVAPIPDGSNSTNSVSVVCDGDGISGKRVQVVYARPSTAPDRYAAYLSSFQQWAAGVDVVFANAATQTGGTRHVRFVTDANCTPTVLNVTLSPTGADDLYFTENELAAQGYNRSDRKYMLFVDAYVYCGISDTAIDDQPGPANLNNQGATYSRIDAGCWSDVIAAHELVHQLGGVQLSAPHSSGEFHCWDGSDFLCRPTNGTPVQSICPSTSALVMDCNSDDYYNVNPPAGSYLATHWNTANSQYLVGTTQVTLTPRQGTAVVDGRAVEWTLTPAGPGNQDWYLATCSGGIANCASPTADLFARFDCATHTLYVLGLADRGVPYAADASANWITIGGIGNKVVLDGAAYTTNSSAPMWRDLTNGQGFEAAINKDQNGSSLRSGQTYSITVQAKVNNTTTGSGVVNVPVTCVPTAVTFNTFAASSQSLEASAMQWSALGWGLASMLTLGLVAVVIARRK